MANLISVDELHALHQEEASLRLLDVRWRFDEPDGRPAYLEAHIPGAVFVSLDRELSRVGEPAEGRHPLPRTADLQAAARRWGLNDGDVVVAYDDARGIASARAWWLLRRAGVDVRVLNGGLRAWADAGYQLESEEVHPAVGTVTLTETADGVLTIDEAAAFPRNGVLLDVRAPERYRGELEPIDPVSGHIPGAVNLPTTSHITADDTLRDANSLVDAFAEVGVVAGTAVGVYCGSGVTAAHTVLALAEAGIPSSLFPGSWSQWANTPGRPVALGALPSDESQAGQVTRTRAVGG